MVWDDYNITKSMGKKIRMLFVWKVRVRFEAVSIVDRFAVCSETYISFEGVRWAIAQTYLRDFESLKLPSLLRAG